MECQQQTGGVLALNKGGSSLFHSLQAKLGSWAKILEETLVTLAEAWKRPDGNLTLQSEHGGRKSGIRAFFMWFWHEPLALMAGIKAEYFVSEDTLQLSSVSSFHDLNLCTWDAKAIYCLSAASKEVFSPISFVWSAQVFEAYFPSVICTCDAECADMGCSTITEHQLVALFVRLPTHIVLLM